ncbi:MAG: flagellar biosynthesis anti-sigma factor FlgM [Betaproteobacteria bacterium]|nr:flagellar biosynthesis anti-sigma factor FlgM [Betaproteobacteria bacterium]
MKITNHIDTAGSLERPGNSPSSAAQGKPSSAPAVATDTGSDTIRISELSNQLVAMESRISSDAAFDAGRVEEIKNAMRAGRFKVNPEVVADKLLDSVRELLRKPS